MQKERWRCALLSFPLLSSTLRRGLRRGATTTQRGTSLLRVSRRRISPLVRLSCRYRSRSAVKVPPRASRSGRAKKGSPSRSVFLRGAGKRYAPRRAAFSDSATRGFRRGARFFPQDTERRRYRARMETFLRDTERNNNRASAIKSLITTRRFPGRRGAHHFITAVSLASRRPASRRSEPTVDVACSHDGVDVAEINCARDKVSLPYLRATWLLSRRYPKILRLVIVDQLPWR